LADCHTFPTIGARIEPTRQCRQIRAKVRQSDPIEAVKEDAETTATRKELKNTSISGVMDEERTKTPESESAEEKDVDLKDRISSPKKKRARDQLDDEKAPKQ
jgi:hypothetical protein